MLTVKATGGDSRAADLVEVRRALAVLADQERGIQLQYAPFHAQSFATFPGSDLDSQCDWVKRHEDAKGIYYIHNPVQLHLSRSALVGDILSRRLLFIDVDRDKSIEPENSATDAEHERARGVAERIKEYLVAQNWPAPLFVDSGNGWQILPLISLPNSGGRNDLSRQLVKSFLDALAARFSCAEGSVDTKTCDARRLAKLPGTWARRGTESSERPWRMAHLIECSPDFLSRPIPAELIRETVAKLLERHSPASAPNQVDPVQPPAKSGLVVTATDSESDRLRAYAKSAFERELGILAASPEGDRNNQCNASAFSLGQLVAASWSGISRLDAESSLRLVSLRIGLDAGETESTIRSGLESGMKQPRERPEAQAAYAAVPAAPRTDADRGWKEGESIVYRASSVMPKAVDWLWLNRIPLGKLTTFAGVGGLGKTFVLLDVAARVSRGLSWPDSQGECAPHGDTLFLSGEDEPDDTLVPRLIELGADLERIFFLKTEVQDRFTLADLPTLNEALRQAGGNVRFVAIDPPTAFLGGVDDHKNAELRGLLSPLKSWANQHRCAIVFNTHFTKPQGQKVQAMMRVMGSVAWVNAVRAAHMFARDPESADGEDRRLFVPMKNNLGPEQKGLAYKLTFEPDKMAKIEWLGLVETTADEAVENAKKEDKPRMEAEALLRDLFAGKTELAAKLIWAAANEAKISERQLKKATESLGITRHKQHVAGQQVWVWRWPIESRGETHIDGQQAASGERDDQNMTF